MKKLAQLEDKIDGLESDLNSAIEVLYRHGDVHARDWLWLNYRDKTEMMAKGPVEERRPPEVAADAAWRALKIDDIVWSSVRARNCLLNAGFQYIGEVAAATDYYLIREPNLGRKTIREIRETIDQLSRGEIKPLGSA